MKVDVLFFAILRDISQSDKIEMELDNEMTIAEFFTQLCETFPKLEKYASIVSFAINSEYCDRTQMIHDGDEIALIPPISGGNYG
ncbi:MAG: MoaD/ThiS family protein [Calditrichaeota bacterium]|nr:MAG: MoaD/ThiS family protein [Calditrichota bacterium]